MELVLCLGLFLLALSGALLYVYPEWETARRVGSAEAAVADVRKAVDEVYSSGPGRRETIAVVVPSGVVRTEASKGRIDMVLGLPGGKAADVLEVTSTPVKGYIPSEEGFHRLTVEYMDSGFVVVGNGLVVEPSYTLVETTPSNRSTFTVVVSNAGGRLLADVGVRVRGSSESWFAVNESSFDLSVGKSKSISVAVETEAGVPPGSYANRVVAESADAYAESAVDVVVGGVFCGDGVKDPSEECEVRTPYQFPDEESPHCPKAGRVECETGKYRVFDGFGACDAGCVCKDDDPPWIFCEEGCDDLTYCNNCGHCGDGIKNCGETLVDAGGGCPLPCNPGETEGCGLMECRGVRACGFNGTGYGWGGCSTYGVKCLESKCCTCGGSPEYPVPVFNGTFTSDCTPAYDQVACRFPALCGGGRYRGECVGIDVCEPDWDGSTWPVSDDSSICEGMGCSDPMGRCFDDVYPCHGNVTEYRCNAGTCAASTFGDAGVCGCTPPKTIVLHKLDVNSYDCIDYPKSHLIPGLPSYCMNDPCPEPGQPGSPISQYTFTDIQNTEPGAYYPFRNGVLHIYGKAFSINSYCAHGTGNPFECAESCVWNVENFRPCGGNKIRVGNDQDNFWEYGGPEFRWNAGYWQRWSVDLSSPRNVVGHPDWNGSIGLFQLRYIAFRCRPYDHDPCTVYEDYAVLER